MTVKIEKEHIHDISKQIDSKDIINYVKATWNEYCKFFLSENKSKNGNNLYAIYYQVNGLDLVKVNNYD